MADVSWLTESFDAVLQVLVIRIYPAHREAYSSLEQPAQEARASFRF